MDGFNHAGGGQFDVHRITVDGRFDAGFDERHPGIDVSCDCVPDAHLALLDDGSSRVCYYDGDPEEVTMLAIRADGRADEGFGPDGILRIATTGHSCAEMIVDATGRILLVDQVQGDEVPSVYAVMADGRLDPTFGTEGSVELKREGRIVAAEAMRLDGNGSIHVMGMSRRLSDADDDARWTVAQLTPDGVWSTGLDGNGLALQPTPRHLKYSSRIMSMDPSGAPIIGWASFSEPRRAPDGTYTRRYETTLLRIDARAGTLDLTFGANGRLALDRHVKDVIALSRTEIVTWATEDVDRARGAVLERHDV